jgi:antitoxin (DNA-binding transcriptional repressor) of toxin-antitoxin stability system
MKNAQIGELKNKLSGYLREVRNGDQRLLDAARQMGFRAIAV